uniref:Uncharacterized protein n=1 Tax=Lygus hesperus TaxID=30085 RepID=A0A0K8S7W0_LYGHE
MEEEFGGGVEVRRTFHDLRSRSSDGRPLPPFWPSRFRRSTHSHSKHQTLRFFSSNKEKTAAKTTLHLCKTIRKTISSHHLAHYVAKQPLNHQEKRRCEAANTTAKTQSARRFSSAGRPEYRTHPGDLQVEIKA